MGKIVSNFFITLDGVVESPNLFVFPYFDEAVGAVISAGTEGLGGFLMGRTLYQEWSEHWPSSTDEPFASFINGIDKYVLSDSLAATGTPPEWANTTVIGGDDVAGQVSALKERVSGDLGMSGSPTTVGWLAANGLLDEVNLLMAPIAVGTGMRLFDQVRVPLQLIHSAALPTGVMHLRYATV